LNTLFLSFLEIEEEALPFCASPVVIKTIYFIYSNHYFCDLLIGDD